MNTSSSVRWRKSSYSGNQGSNCVEVAPLTPSIGIRDSKVGDSPILTAGAEAWTALLAKLR